MKRDMDLQDGSHINEILHERALHSIRAGKFLVGMPFAGGL